MAFRWYDIVGYIPFIVVGGALAVLGVLFVAFQIPSEVLVELLLSAGTIWLIVIAVLLFVSMTCASIQVRELFEDGSVTTEDLAALENKVCVLMTASDKAIASDVGQPGQDDPAVLNAALTSARGSAPVPVCEMNPTELESRISRMENALMNYTGPQLKKTYDKSVPCSSEGFETQNGTYAARLQAINQLVDKQTSTLLVPIQKKEADVKAGILSDCEKKKGAKAAVVPAS
jgi:hypothetical protein